MKTIIIFGGAGYIGSHLTEHWLSNGLTERVIIADIKPPEAMPNGAEYVYCDVRKQIPPSSFPSEPEWIFNLAAIHREPGHLHEEYFDTNVHGAENITDLAEKLGCRRIFFTSSISVYGEATSPTPETASKKPLSPYGCSKYVAELIHERWLARDTNRRLVVVRPGVVYGPRDPGNIGRMITAIRRGYFLFPGRTDIKKSYAYIYGLMDSIDFVFAKEKRFVSFNYVETPTETLGQIAGHTKTFIGKRSPILSLPKWLLMPMAYMMMVITSGKSAIHPTRVRKASLSTNIVPQVLIDLGYIFKFDFMKSLGHWQSVMPSDWDNEKADIHLQKTKTY